MSYLGDYAEDYATLNFKFNSRTAAGAPVALAGTPSLAVYKANDLTQSTAGITLTADFDSVTGLNNVLIDLSADAFYAVGQDYEVVIAVGTADSVSVVGVVVGSFSIENRSDILTTQMTESYAADGTAPTVAQALFLIQQMLAERDVTSTTLTVKKLDGSTSAATFTLDSATAPTSQTRAT